jgi:hypothetical protein
MSRPHLICKWIRDEQGLHCKWVKVGRAIEHASSVSAIRLRMIYEEISSIEDRKGSQTQKRCPLPDRKVA